MESQDAMGLKPNYGSSVALFRNLKSNSLKQLLCWTRIFFAFHAVPQQTESLEGIFYHQGTQAVEKSFNPTWVGALQFYILYF